MSIVISILVMLGALFGFRAAPAAGDRVHPISLPHSVTGHGSAIVRPASGSGPVGAVRSN